MCAGSTCRPWGNKHQSKYSPNFDTELGKTNVGQGRVLPAQSCAKLTHVFPLARACLLVRVRHGLAGAESEGGSTADQPGSAKARSAAPRRDTGKVRLLCRFLFSRLGAFYELSRCQKKRFLPSTTLDLLRPGKFLQRSLLTDKSDVTALWLLRSSIRALSHLGTAEAAAGNENGPGLIHVSQELHLSAMLTSFVPVTSSRSQCPRPACSTVSSV